MDPNQTLQDMMIIVLEIGEEGDKNVQIYLLGELIQKAEDLREWLQKGGSSPEMYVNLEFVD